MRAVNADDLIHELDKDGIMEYGYVSVFGIPIIEDCVPVVRCKDCKHKRMVLKSGCLGCDIHCCLHPYDWYCPDGEKVKKDGII